MKRFLFIQISPSLISICCVFLFCQAIVDPESTRFDMTEFPDSIRSIPDQKCVFLLRTSEEEEGKGKGNPIEIQATSPSDVSINVQPEKMRPNEVAEVSVTPSDKHVNQSIQLEIQTHRVFIKTAKVLIHVVPGQDDFYLKADSIRQRFVSWLQDKHPELGITTDTQWQASIVAPNISDVANYLFFSQNWEMGISWHITAPPDDWGKMYLRKRWQDIQPVFAYAIESLESDAEPVSIDPPLLVIR
jgi:hypothetical protein